MSYCGGVRIAVDVTPLAGSQTGIGRFVKQLVKGLSTYEDLELVGLAMTARGREEIAALIGDDVALSRPAPARLLREVWKRVDWLSAEKLTGPVDVVHGTNYVVPPTTKAAQLVSVHDLSAWHDSDLVHSSSRDYPQLVQRALDRGAHVHAISAHVGAEIRQELGVPEERLHVVHLGLTPGPPATPGAGRAQTGGRPYLLAVGTIEPRKDFPLLVDVFADLADTYPELDLVIAGGPGWGVEDLQAAIERNKLASRVHRVGFVSDQQKADLLAEAELVVSAARYEGFGFVPLEAMAAGTPVVAVAGGAIPEVCGDAAQIVPVGDPAALTSAIGSVLADAKLSESLIASGHERSKCFTWRETIAGLRQVYSDLT